MDATTYFEPLTGRGFPLSGEKPPGLHIHECGSLVLAADWNHQGVYSPFWRAYFNQDHGAAIHFEGKRYELAPDRLLLLPEHVLFDCLPREKVRHIWIHFSLEKGPSQRLRPISLKLSQAEQSIWSETAARITRARTGDEPALRQLCAGLLLVALSQATPLATIHSPALRSLLLWIEQSLSLPLNIDTLASQAGMGARTFLDWFKAGIGVTPMMYLKAQRIREACRLLRFTTDTIDQIASVTGFANRYHFSRVFRQQTGVPPAAYRLRSSGKHREKKVKVR